MDVRMRSTVSRTAKGYSVEATLDMGSGGDPITNIGKDVDILSAFQVVKLKEHIQRLEEVFPKEV